MTSTLRLFAVSAVTLVAAVCVFVLACGERSLAHLPYQGPDATPLRQAIIVVRHARDQDACVQPKGVLSDRWRAIAPDWPVHKDLPAVRAFDAQGSKTESTSVETLQHCLSDIGEQQALRLRDELPEILRGQNLAPVSRVIVINPQVKTPEYATANPFDTLLPFILANRDTIRSIDLLCNNGCAMKGEMSQQLYDLTKAHALLDGANGGSTLVCWTGEGLNQTTDGHHALLERLAGDCITEGINQMQQAFQLGVKGGMGYSSGKGNALYIFTPRPYSAKTDGEGRMGAMASVNGNCPEQKYDLSVFHAMCKKDEPREGPDISNFHSHWTHSFVIHEVSPTAADAAGTFPTRVYSTPGIDAVSDVLHTSF